MNTKHTPGPWVFLEEGRTEDEGNRSRPLTICDERTSNDLAQVFSNDDSTVSMSRDEAIANARLMALAPQMYQDILTLALRLYSENDDTFAPETREVMNRWRPVIEATLFGEAA